jgi:hypothetical protein
MGQLEALENGIQGANLKKEDANFKGTTYNIDGKSVAPRENNNPQSQTHAVGGGPDYNSVGKHSALDLDGKTPKKYEKPADISGNF